MIRPLRPARDFAEEIPQFERRRIVGTAEIAADGAVGVSFGSDDAGVAVCIGEFDCKPAGLGPLILARRAFEEVDGGESFVF